MNIALFAVPGLLAPLQDLFRWFTSSALPAIGTAPPSTLRQNEITTNSIASHARQTRATGENSFRIQTLKPSPALFTLPALPTLPTLPTLPRLPTISTLPALPILRVVRVLEAGQATANVGRMVISGRMADVCAELDRLAAREATKGAGGMQCKALRAP